MTDYSEQGAIPIEDAATDHPPTVDDVLARQRREHPEQVAGSMITVPMTDDERAAIDAGGEPVGASKDGVDIEGPNSE